MDLFDLSQIGEFIRLEPGHGLVQSLLLFMIWLNSRGVKKELITLTERLLDMKAHHEERFSKVEDRLTILEKRGTQ